MSCSRSPFTRLGYVSLRVMCPVIPVLPHYMIPSSHATFRTYYITSTRKSCTLHATPTYAVRHTVLPYKLSSLTPSQKPVLTMHIRTFNIALHIFTLLLFLLTDHITLLHFPSFTETFLYIKNMHLVPTFSSVEHCSFFSYYRMTVHVFQVSLLAFVRYCHRYPVLSLSLFSHLSWFDFHFLAFLLALLFLISPHVEVRSFLKFAHLV